MTTIERAAFLDITVAFFGRPLEAREQLAEFLGAFADQYALGLADTLLDVSDATPARSEMN